MGEKVWFPLESNPEIMTDYMEKLGLNTDVYSFHDVFSTEDWALEMIPRPVLSVLLLFPISPQSENHAEAEANSIIRDGQKVSSSVHFMKQTISNACGTIALLHCISNAHEFNKVDLSFISILILLV
jgi:ubiquitin carboxyl-terminal hydrolase L3